MLERFPTLPGIDVKIVRTEVWPTNVQSTPSGMELRGSWSTTPRLHYTVSFEFLRSDQVEALRDELGQLAEFFSMHRGAALPFVIDDPITGNPVTVRFASDELNIERLFPTSSSGRPIWKGNPIELVSVKGES